MMDSYYEQPDMGVIGGFGYREKAMEINDKNLRAFRNDFMKAVEALEEQYDVSISMGNITYEEERFTAKITVNKGRDPEEIARAEFDANVWKFAHLGLAPGMYRRVFIGYTGERYALIGLNTRAPKYPLIIARISDGEVSRAGERFIKTLLNEYYQESVIIPKAALPGNDESEALLP